MLLAVKVFIGSMQCMNSSLEKLVKNFIDNDFRYLTEEFGYKNLELLKQKDAYPLEYMDSFKRFSEEKLPDKPCFYSSVKDGTTGDNGKKLDGHISGEDYLTCKEIWNEFNMKNMGDYHDHCLKKDVLLLTDVFEKFINTCLKIYGLDSCHYFSSLGLNWDVMLKMTSMRLKKIVDIDMYLFIEKGLRGGISYIVKGYGLRGGISHIVKGYAKANNKYMKYYDSKTTSKFITYLDINNLYG